MKLPEPTRCCCCIPLRYGLIGLGNVKLVISLLMLFDFMRDIFELVVVQDGIPDLNGSMLLSSIVFAYILDISLVVMFLVAAYRKNVKYLRIYYIYSMFVLCFYILYFIRSAVMEFTAMNDTVLYWTIEMWISIFALGFQIYFTLLLRSEINKLRNNSTLKLDNEVTEDQTAEENGTN